MHKFNESIYLFEFEVNLGLGITFPTRSTLVELNNDRALIISPGPFDAETMETLKNEYEEIVFSSPNAFHHLYLEKTKSDFPESNIYAPDGVFKKQPQLVESLIPIKELAYQISKDITVAPISGNKKLDEYYFWHPVTKTLIVTDLFFHMCEPMPRLRRWVLKLVGAYNKIGQSLLVKKTTDDKEIFRQSIRQLAELKPQSIIIAHGAPIIGEFECQRALANL